MTSLSTQRVTVRKYYVNCRLVSLLTLFVKLMLNRYELKRKTISSDKNRLIMEMYDKH